MYVIKYLNNIQKGYSLMLGGVRVLVLVATSIVRPVKQLLNWKTLCLMPRYLIISWRPALPWCCVKILPDIPSFPQIRLCKHFQHFLSLRRHLDELFNRRLSESSSGRCSVLNQTVNECHFIIVIICCSGCRNQIRSLIRRSSRSSPSSSSPSASCAHS